MPLHPVACILPFHPAKTAGVVSVQNAQALSLCNL